MALRKAQAARQAGSSIFKLDASQLLWAVISVVGLFPLVVLALLALIVLLVIFAMAGGSQLTSASADPSDPNGQTSRVNALIELSGGDGRGTFDPRNIPDQDLVAPIREAAKKCDLLTPVILAAQIDYASAFDPDMEGPQGRKGLSQLTPEVFDEFGEDDDDSGEASVLDPEDSIHAHARYFCHLAERTGQLSKEKKVVGDHLSLTLMAWEIGLETVEAQGGMPVLALGAYPFQVRGLFEKYTSTGTEEPDPDPVTDEPDPEPDGDPDPDPTPPDEDGPDVDGSTLLSESVFTAMFPNRNSFYTYAGLRDAMAKFPAFAATGDEQTRKRELAAFLANVNHESGGLVHIEEINQAAWGNYCDTGQPYGCPAGQTAYHGRGPIQLSWNTNYKAAGDALGLDLLNQPDLVRDDPSVAWQTALWFWTTQTGAGTMTAHSAMTGGGGFGETIRTINGALECGGGNSAQVQARVAAYERFATSLGVEVGNEDDLTC
ncbi:glycoside hydrolase family 19 protein [Micromonospora sp. NBC_01739]|uniref:glycoside hydrolase family 19 protein n=1 Tax=Micromonospora sp. NBC_01739 TaxID=2975985 RepID=UPI002E136E84|nr:transglycosylase SLT domain-containing protein [Micromonospora sp. NBC_01739]